MAATVRAAEVAEGEELKPWTYKVTREDLVRYAKASGDQNPIHQDEGFAKSVGLPDVIAHGMQTMARMGQYLTDWAGDPGAVVRLKTRFTSVVVVPKDGGNEVTVSGVVRRKLDASSVLVEVIAYTPDGTKVAAGEAEIQLS